MNIYVGNLAYTVSDEELRAAFARHGTVSSAEVIIDRRSGRSRGYGFVEMPDEAQARAAIAALNGAEIKGRGVRVDVSQPKAEGAGAARPGREAAEPPRARRRPAAPATPSTPARRRGLMGFLKRLFG